MKKFTTLALATLVSACSVSTQSSSAEPQVPSEPTASETPAPGEGSGGGTCTSDADCVPASCCHAAACVIRDEAPDCSETMCTKECRYGTLDCGGQCLCQEGKCVAQLSEPPAP